MRADRLLWNAVLLALPAGLLAAAGVYFLIDKVPELARNEQRRVLQEYRELAVEAKEAGRGEEFDFKSSGFLKSSSRKIQREHWGYGPGVVWYVRDGRAFRLGVPPVKESNLWILFYPAGVLIIVAMAGMTAFGVRYFWKFVKSREDFLAATAHDLTTPLVGMRLTIGRNDAEARRLNERMLLVVGNIKDFLRLGGRRRKPDLKPVDLEALCREAYALFADDYADAAGGAVDFRVGPGAPRPVLADETMTVQILWNLFGNDLKYAAPYGKVAVRISFGARDATVAFVDEGQGLTPAQMRRAFDRYYRARTVLETGKGGFGIGLCTAREFARAMGGDLTVRANEPRGCVFALTLPTCSP